MILDAGKEGLQKHRGILEGELESVGIRLNKHPPDITLVRKKGGGIKFNNTVPLPQWGPDPQRVALDILKQHKVNNAEILVRCDCTIDDFIDVVMGNRKYIRCLYAYNKIDTVTVEEIDQLARNPHSIVISVNQGYNMDYLLERVSSYCSEGGSEGGSEGDSSGCVFVFSSCFERRPSSLRLSLPHSFCALLTLTTLFSPLSLSSFPLPSSPSPSPPPPSQMWDYLGLTRVYTKRRGNPPDLSEPVVLTAIRRGTTVRSLCAGVSSQMLRDFAFAMVWGVSAKHSPMRCGITHQLSDQDVVQIMTKTASQQKNDKNYQAMVQEFDDKFRAGRRARADAKKKKMGRLQR